MFIGNLTQFFTYDTRTPVIDASGVFYMNPSPRAAATNSNITTTTTAYTFNAPSISDNNLGWEINAGVDWKLLELDGQSSGRVLEAWAMVQLRLCRQDGSKLEHTNYLPVRS